MINEFNKNLNEAKSELGILNVVQFIPKFSESFSVFLNKNTIETVALTILNKSKREKGIGRKQALFDFLTEIWDFTPEAVRFKIMLLIFINISFNSNTFLLSAINTVISLARIKDDTFHKNLLNINN